MSHANNQAPRVVEVRVISHTNEPRKAAVAVLMSDGTSSALDQLFASAELAEAFAAGMRSGMSWQAMCIAAGIRSAAQFQDDHAMQPLSAEHFAGMIERDYQ